MQLYCIIFGVPKYSVYIFVLYLLLFTYLTYIHELLFIYLREVEYFAFSTYIFTYSSNLPNIIGNVLIVCAIQMHLTLIYMLGDLVCIIHISQSGYDKSCRPHTMKILSVFFYNIIGWYIINYCTFTHSFSFYCGYSFTGSIVVLIQANKVESIVK